MYSLQKYTNPSSRHTCPGCGRHHCFTLYVDENGDPLHETVGRCDHESSCAYHYTPKQFFADHPDLKPGPDWREAKPQRPSKPIRTEPYTIPFKYVRLSVRHDRDSDLITYLRTQFDDFVIEQLIDEYQIGVTRSQATIFFQIDCQGRCRTGKIMRYDSSTGHRIKDESVPGRISWVHSELKRSGVLPDGWELNQCLFGESLLPKYPDKVVALVESEKTAIIASALMPKYLWLATGGKSCINDRLLVLRGRKVVAFPDVDGYEDWTRKLAAYPDLGIKISPVLQQNATPEDLENHIDIADWLIRSRLNPPAEPGKKHCSAFLRAARYLDPDCQNEVEALIEDLGLELWEVNKL